MRAEAEDSEGAAELTSHIDFTTDVLLENLKLKYTCAFWILLIINDESIIDR